MWRKSQNSGTAPPFYREMCDIADQYPTLMVDTTLGGGDTGRTDRTGETAAVGLSGFSRTDAWNTDGCKCERATVRFSR